MEDNIKVQIADTECIEAMKMIRKKQPYPISCSNKISEAQFVLPLFEEKQSHAA